MDAGGTNDINLALIGLLCDTWSHLRPQAENWKNLTRKMSKITMRSALNKRTRRTYPAFRDAYAKAKRPRWVSKVGKQSWSMYRLLKSVSVPRQPRSVEQLPISRSIRRILCDTGVVAATAPSLKAQSEKAAKKLWDSMRNRQMVLWLDNWYWQRFSSDLVKKLSYVWYVIMNNWIKNGI